MKKVIVYRNRVLFPFPQGEFEKWIIKRRLLNLEQTYVIKDLELYPVIPTPQEQAAWDAIHTPEYKYYAVVTRIQLGNYLGISGVELDEVWSVCRQNLAGTLALYKLRFTDDAYVALGSGTKSVLYPLRDRSEEEPPFITVNGTIYEYLEINRALWENEV
jgi:hypothetical protein